MNKFNFYNEINLYFFVLISYLYYYCLSAIGFTITFSIYGSNCEFYGRKYSLKFILINVLI